MQLQLRDQYGAARSVLGNQNQLAPFVIFFESGCSLQCVQQLEAFLVVCLIGNPAEAAAVAAPAVEATGAADVKFEPAADCVFWCGLITAPESARSTLGCINRDDCKPARHRWVPVAWHARPSCASCTSSTVRFAICNRALQSQTCVTPTSLFPTLTITVQSPSPGRCPRGRAATSSALQWAATMCPAGRSRCTWGRGYPMPRSAGSLARRSR